MEPHDALRVGVESRGSVNSGWAQCVSGEDQWEKETTPEGRHLARSSLAEATGFEPAVSALTGLHVRPLHHASVLWRSECYHDSENSVKIGNVPDGCFEGPCAARKSNEFDGSLRVISDSTRIPTPRRRSPYKLRWPLLAVFSLIMASILANANAAAPQFGLPFSGAPGPSTWYVAQWYGSTQWAYRNWHDQYSQGQGLHFGVDFAAPCNTPVHAIGDGVVYAIDGPYGAAPHNVVINHQNGYFSLYGHLHQRSSLAVGQDVKQGDVIGLSGDPTTQSCDQSSHLHLEIRTSGMSVAVNPVPLIAADWRAVTIGADTPGQHFELFYNDPGTWMTNEDQPQTQFGGPILNRTGPAWPPD